MAGLDKISQVYKEVGIKGTLIRAMRKSLKNAGTSLIKVADNLPMPVYQSNCLPDSDRVLLEKNQIFKNKHKGKRCFIIGDGPSLKDIDLSPLGDEITFVTNSFWKHAVVGKWQPKYYCMFDPVYFEEAESVREYFYSLRSKIHQAKFFIPLYHHIPLNTIKLIEEQKMFPPTQTFFVAFAGALYQSRHLDIDLTNFVPAIHNVAQFCLMLSIYMGCSPIYLLGLDHNWLAEPESDSHFYEGDTLPQTAHAYKNYKTRVEAVLRIWAGYEMLLDIAVRRNISIFNATEGSYLDVFKRIKYESLVVGESIAK